MKTRIAIYGGPDISDELIEFVKSLTKTLLNINDVVIISGGFQHYWQNKKKKIPKPGTSVDKAVMDEALKYKTQHKLSDEKFKERFETWIPKMQDRTDVKRFAEGKIVKLNGSSQSRRFKVVQNVDAIVTIGGEGHTRSVIELALAINKPVLPLSFSHGDSSKMWKTYQSDILKNLNAGELLKNNLNKLSSEITMEEATQRGIDIANVLKEYGKKICLVLMPFSTKNNNKFYDHLEEAIKDSGCTPHRIDKNDKAGNIPDLFFSSLDRAKFVIVDITGNNPNVIYELGHVHSKKINPLILRREPKLSALPFYFLQEMVHTAKDNNEGYEQLCEVVKTFLKST